MLATARGGLADSAEILTPVSRAAALAALSSLILAGARFFLNGADDPVAYTLLGSSAGFAVSAALARSKLELGVSLLPWVGMCGVFAMAFFEGGLQSEALPWAPFAAMLVPICLRGASMVLAVVTVLALPCVLLSAGGVAASSTWLRWFGLEGALLFGMGLSVAFSRWRQESLSALWQEHSRLQFVIDNLRSGIAVTDAVGTVVAANARLLHLLELPKQEMLGQRFTTLLQSRTKPAPRLSRVEEDSSAHDQITVGDRVYEMRCDTHGEGESRLVLWSFVEVTRRVRSYSEALGRLEKDALTGLYNRAHLLRQLKHATQGENGFALFFIDLDGFKPINDSQGHAAGDQILKAVGTRLRSVLRAGDVACRLGGDEFCVIAHGVREGSQAGTIAEKLISAVKEPYGDISGVGCSVGISIFPHAARHPESLLERADVAMYAAKRKGGNRWAISRPSMDMETVA